MVLVKTSFQQEIASKKCSVVQKLSATNSYWRKKPDFGRVGIQSGHFIPASLVYYIIINGTESAIYHGSIRIDGPNGTFGTEPASL
jgi:hypothetical protein